MIFLFRMSSKIAEASLAVSEISTESRKRRWPRQRFHSAVFGLYFIDCVRIHESTFNAKNVCRVVDSDDG